MRISCSAVGKKTTGDLDLTEHKYHTLDTAAARELRHCKSGTRLLNARSLMMKVKLGGRRALRVWVLVAGYGAGSLVELARLWDLRKE
ncbi:hypothetical protein E2542_SST31062 [Spatholobus suberectus]|nr:hypothetical protein E2542_SST31062 [Spatholobus suberectus]